MNVIQKKVVEAAGFIDSHKREIILGAFVTGSVIIYRNGYLSGCVNGAMKTLEGLEKTNPAAYKALIDEAVSKGIVIKF